MSDGSAETPLDVVVRFSTSNSDLVITISRPSRTSALSLKQQIRSQLDGAAASARLRLIHAGKVLQDNFALSKSLNVTAPPPLANGDAGKSEKAKGKQPVRDTSKPPSAARVYIHCSIGDALTSSDLASEIKAAEDADKALISKTSSLNTDLGTEQDGAPKSTTTPAPRGFDRLLTTGFTPAEVAALRTQFLAIQAHTNTPDTMPSGPELLALEEQWLDNTHSTSGADGIETGGFGGQEAGGLEDMLWGNLIGFFWPVGAMCWLMREEGVWSRRRQIAVISGFLVNLTFGFLRVMN